MKLQKREQGREGTLLRLIQVPSLAIHRLKRLKEKERTRKMRKKRKTEKVGEDVSEEEEESTDSEGEEHPALEPALEQDVAATSTANSEMERASRVVDEALSSTKPQTDKNVTEEDSSKVETTPLKKYLNTAEDSESEEVSEEDGEEGNLWGAILGPKKIN